MEPIIAGATEWHEIAGIRTDVHIVGEGPPLLLLHSGDAREFGADFVNRLAKRHRVILPTHPGFRNTELPARFVSVDDLAYFYLDLLRAFSLTDVTIAGMSMGGWIAAEIAIRSTERLRSLVLVDAFGIKVGGREDRDIADFFGLSTAQIAELSFVDKSLAVVELEGRPDEEVLATVRNREALAYYGWRPYMHNPSLTGWLHRIDVPTLVLWGAADRVVTPDYGRKYAELIPGATFQLIENAAHYPHLEQPARFAELVTEFTRKHGAQNRAA
jgi:pimeloyl-ACP methyl ester carboxylesterase